MLRRSVVVMILEYINLPTGYLLPSWIIASRRMSPLHINRTAAGGRNRVIATIRAFRIGRILLWCRMRRDQVATRYMKMKGSWKQTAPY